MDYHAHRRTALLRNASQSGLSALLLTNPVNVTYLTGFTGDSSFLFLSAARTVLISDARFDVQIAEECPDLEVVIRPHTQTLPAATGELLTKSGARTIGVEADHLTLSLFESLRISSATTTFAPQTGMVEALRVVKDPSEVERIRDAIRAAEQAFAVFQSSLQASDTEKDLADAMDHYLRRAGARGSSFPPIVAVGDRGALPHAVPTTQKLADASTMLVDWGADLGYKSDLTRTFRTPFATRPRERNRFEPTGRDFEEIYDAVLRAQTAAAETVRAGVAAKDVDAAARRVLAEAGYGDYFTHGLGHGIGLEIHELPRVRADSTDILESGMVITLEPGVYIQGWGGVRIEDDYLVTKDGAVRLSTLPHDPSGIG